MARAEELMGEESGEGEIVDFELRVRSGNNLMSRLNRTNLLSFNQQNNDTNLRSENLTTQVEHSRRPHAAFPEEAEHEFFKNLMRKSVARQEHKIP
jgi:hypothetical protein